MKKSVSIIGSCVCRDLFMGNKEKYEYLTDIRFSSPISMLAKPLNFINADFKHLKKRAMDVNGNWFKKTLLNDINKTAFSSLEEKHGEYLITDLVEARMNIATIRWTNREEQLVLTNSGLFRKHYRFNLCKNIMKNTSIEVTRVFSLSIDYWDKIIKEYTDKILSLFKETNIILIKNMPASYYVDGIGCLQHFKTSSHCSEIFECNLLLPKLYDIFLKYCPNVNVIEIPKLAIGDANHIWKTNPFHFTKNYYTYLQNCVDAILNNQKQELTKLYDKYSTIFDNDFKEAMIKQIDNYYSADINGISYKEIIDGIEEFAEIGRRKKIHILFACSKKDFFKHAKEYIKK